MNPWGGMPGLGAPLAGSLRQFELGETRDVRELVPGDPGRVWTQTGELSQLTDHMERTAQALSRISSDGWQGEAADAFREYFRDRPRQWDVLAGAFRHVADALGEYKWALEAAQRRATDAVALYETGQRESEAARTEYNQKAERYSAAVASLNAGLPTELPPQPGEFIDGGAAKMEEARQLLADARARKREAAETAAAAIRAATDRLPEKPGWLSRTVAEIDDLQQRQVVQVTDFLGGAAEGIGGIIKLSRTLNPLDVYNLAHPQDYLTNLGTLGSGLAAAVTHPVATLKHIVDVDTLLDSPGRWLGRLAPDVALGAVTGGVGAAAGAGVDAATLGVASVARSAAGKLARSTGREAVEEAGQAASKAGRAGEHAPGGPHPPTTPHVAGDHTAESGNWFEPDDSFVREHGPFGPGGTPDSATPAGGQPTTSPDPGPGAGMAGADQRAADGIGQAGGGLADVERQLDTLGPADTSVPQSSPTATAAPGPVHAVSTPPGHPSTTPPGTGEVPPPPVSGTPEPPHLRERPDYANPDFEARGQDQHDYWDQHPGDRDTIRSLRQLHTEEMPWLRGVRDAELDAMLLYQRDLHRPLNDALRSADPEALAAWDTEIRVLTSGLNHVPDYQGTVFRGLHFDDTQSLIRFVEHYQPGTIVHDPGFASADKLRAMPDTNVELVITSQHGKDISFLSNQQDEVVFPPGSRFQVLARTDAGDKIRIHLLDLGR
ncbi:putative T7SS-secreted protein [Longimycelium tulufanense]|nr:ADP-ribosyltransferase domain-containing protein [Longimycelium tulufanense]